MLHIIISTAVPIDITATVRGSCDLRPHQVEIYLIYQVCTHLRVIQCQAYEAFEYRRQRRLR